MKRLDLWATFLCSHEAENNVLKERVDEIAKDYIAFIEDQWNT